METENKQQKGQRPQQRAHGILPVVSANTKHGHPRPVLASSQPAPGCLYKGRN